MEADFDRTRRGVYWQIPINSGHAAPEASSVCMSSQWKSARDAEKYAGEEHNRSQTGHRDRSHRMLASWHLVIQQLHAGTMKF